MRPAVWRCKVEHCREWGHGGPKAAANHLGMKHGSGPGVVSSHSMGFTPGLEKTKYRGGDPGQRVWCHDFGGVGTPVERFAQPW